ncbi:MAG: hypothetical protein HOP28_12860 [Gemmatimonadales bacterium]|nr:hypothetical protein [Gemmatimonadales bacterium]
MLPYHAVSAVTALMMFQSQVRYLNPRWSPDGRRLMYEANADNPRRLDLYVMNADGGAPTRLREDARNGSWSPDGAFVLFASPADGDLDVYVMKADGSDVRQLTNTPEMDYQPAWSPDGRRIVFVSIPAGGGQKHDVHMMNADGSGRAPVMQTPDAEEMAPNFGPGGRQIAFYSNRDGNWEVYVANADGSGARRMTEDPGNDLGPSFAPDGRSIAFTSTRSGAPRMYRMGADGTGATQLGEHAGTTMSWARDGQRIAYVAQVDGSVGIFVMNQDGTGARRVTPIPPPQVVTNKLGTLKWLAGCWERRAGTRVTLEMWMPPEGELMLGASRTVVSGVTREFEQLRLQARGDTITYTAIPSGQRETAFKSTQFSDSAFTVENLAHDFPQRIIYQRRGTDSLLARIEGPGQNGATRGVDFPMRRVGCGG